MTDDLDDGHRSTKPDVIKAALSVGKQESVLYKEIWNEAIEAAACECDGGEYPDRIRKLKK